jgi:DNA-binding transcriptional MerR regulator
MVACGSARLLRQQDAPPNVVRNYHRTGALPEPERTPNGYRDYTVDDVARLIRLTTLTAAGIPATTVARITDHRGLLQDALLAVGSRIEELHRQRSRILSLLTGGRSIPPDIIDLLTDFRQWTMGREPEDPAVVALLDLDTRALQLMVDTDMTTADTWTLLRSSLVSAQARESSLAGYHAWHLLGDVTSADPDMPDLIARCRRGLRDGVFSGLTETLRPGDLPLSPADIPVTGAQSAALPHCWRSSPRDASAQASRCKAAAGRTPAMDRSCPVVPG